MKAGCAVRWSRAHQATGRGCAAREISRQQQHGGTHPSLTSVGTPSESAIALITSLLTSWSSPNRLRAPLLSSNEKLQTCTAGAAAGEAG